MSHSIPLVCFYSKLSTCLSLGAVLCLTGACNEVQGGPRNLLLIIADDLGYGDLGCTGSETIATPRIDELAASGVLCTRAYVASAVCSPSRAGLITGRDPRRFGYEANLNNSAENYPTRPELLGLPPTEHTLGDHLRRAGYATALIGKWHLGLGEGCHPNRRGFDHFCGMLGGGHSYFPEVKSHQIERNGERVAEFSSEYLTDFFTDEAIRWIDGRSEAAPKAPWLLYLSYNAPHTPLEATEADLTACAGIKDPKRRTYAAMVRALDRGIGRVLDRLDELGERDQTVVVFLSDNGGAPDNASWNGQLSGAKGSLREGGVRVPMIWSWPERLPAGEWYDGPVSSLDLLPTFLAVAGAKPIPLKPTPPYADPRNSRRMVQRFGAYDGLDILPALAGDQPAPDRELYWRLQGQAAVLAGEDKFIRLGHRPAQLFRPGEDKAEQTDRSATAPDKSRQMNRKLADWEASLPTVPLWDSSPYWWGESARIYDNSPPRPEPK
jgi:arylsulfatase B